MAGKRYIEIDVIDKEVRQKIADLEAASGNVKPAMQVVGRKIKTKVQLGFRTSTDPWGKPWDKLKYRKGKPLKDTGHLLKSITAQLVDGGDSVEIGTNLRSDGGVPFPAVHQFGSLFALAGKKGPSRVYIPARPFLPLDPLGPDMPDQWAVDVLLALRSHFEKAAKA